MPLWLQLVIIFPAWFAVAIAPAAKYGYEDRHKSEKRGVSLFPAFPVMPIAFGGAVYWLGADSKAAQVISWLHAVALVMAILYIVKWKRKSD